MDKTRLQILEEFEPEWVDHDNKPFYNEDQVTEAMKIAMKQAYKAGGNSVYKAEHNEKQYVNFESYLKNLEEQSNG